MTKICTHAGVVSQAECPWCQIDEKDARIAELQAEVDRYRELVNAEWERLQGLRSPAQGDCREG